MPYFCSRSLVVLSVSFLVVPGACIAAPECNSIETRKAVLDFVSGDGSNPLVTYAAKNSTAGQSAAAGEPQKSKNERCLYINSVRR